MRSPARKTPAEPGDRSIRRSWWLLSGTFVLLGLVGLVRLVLSPDPLDFALIGLLVAAAAAAALHRRAVAAVEARRRAEAESFARIFQGLSRSVSSDAIVGAIVEELALGSGADHVVVVRRRADTRVLEATLVSSRAGVAAAITQLPMGALEDPIEASSERTTAGAPGWEPRSAVGTLVADGNRMLLVESRPTGAGAVEQAGALPPTVAVGRQPTTGPLEASAAQRVADRIAVKVGEVYGLKNPVAAPLRSGDVVIGAIVLSRRTADPWPAAARRLLAGAAGEASAALARANSYREAQARASTDALTGLPNRRYFNDVCALLSRRRRAEDAIAILMIDVDEFKSLNDRFGHDAGDRALRSVASVVAGAIRGDDVPARFGGDEFIVLLRNAGREAAVEVGERIRRAVRALDIRDSGISGVSVSIGVAVPDSPEQTIPELLKRADRALYSAKRAGRDRVIAA